MIDQSVQGWLSTMGQMMVSAAENGDAKAMYEVLTIVAGQADRFVTPARVASERVTLENEGILS
jgi:hypothetical protein